MDDIRRAAELLARGPAMVLGGAGLSTASGIPDYRGPGTIARARRPIQHREFLTSAEARRRYWARSFVGWPAMAAARPNAAHHALAELEQDGRISLLVTQNVDGLHQAAGSREVLELHGALRDVSCLDCGQRLHRAEVQARMADDNPGFAADGALPLPAPGDAELAPDGDAEVTAVAAFRPPACPRCGGPLKPDVVFFGGNVPRERVDRAYDALARSSSLFVAGSSLAVFSGWRFVKRATELGLPVVVVNLGPTRADGVAAVLCDRDVTLALPRIRAIGG